ncbi:MAG: type 2 isopentenyl-diphosphate Delta-isomerase [Armatimonadetes bacterium]|nr:type 2 isopentenyl-diphosphate Delta-isomerase [Armatimonadota bacterium]
MPYIRTSKRSSEQVTSSRKCSSSEKVKVLENESNALRKDEHIRIALYEDVEFHTITTGFERYSLPYEALPEINRCDVDTSMVLFGKRLLMPLVISPMTGGTDEGRKFNRLFAEAARRFGLAMGVGSQRIALEDPELTNTFEVRDIAPDILLFANLGAIQLNNSCGVESCICAVTMIGADALILHLNPLQESVQPGGDTNFADLASRISEVCRALRVPVLVKEVGHGISARTARLLVEAGVAGIDVAGAGGTSWAKVEMLRLGSNLPQSILAKKGKQIDGGIGEWGIPTAESLIAVRQAARGLVVISSGGIRTGEDIAKSIALGANATGIALPLLRSAAVSREALHEYLARLKEELQTVMFCSGARTIKDLRKLQITRIGAINF